ncbi:MAG: urea carboxylase-associated family protein [Betaproteobacteria bacterium]|nr:MAG: urea carboxylase-associated family protein [Betaproteobacteria bacterium]
MDAALGETRTIPARSGKAVRVTKGQTINVINTHGEQVVDTWAFNAGDLCEFMSMEHTRATILKLIPQVGDTLRTNRRRPILTLREDTSPGVHDTLLAACDDYRYRLLGCNEYHDNCTDNLFAGLQELGQVLEFCPPVSRPGDRVALVVEMDCIVVFSACPQDILPINGIGRKPTEAHFVITSELNKARG